MSVERAGKMAFQKVQALAAVAAGANLLESPVDTDHDHYYEHLETVRTKMLGRELREDGATGLFTFKDHPGVGERRSL